jgi:hypothetical protein
MENVLSDLYYNLKNPSAFTSASQLYYACKKIIPNITLNDVKRWLSTQLTYTLHRQARKNFQRNKILVTDIGEQYQADLVDMSHFSTSNKSHKYILTVIDCFSRFAWAVPLKTKTGKEVKSAFTRVFSGGAVPEKIQTDRCK